MSFLVAGIDGGQSSTQAAIAEASGRIVGRACGPPADLVGEARDSARQRDALAQTLRGALAAAELPPDAPLAAVVVGLTGCDGATVRVPELEARTDRFALVHDSIVAHAGALGGEAGIVVLAGTGSVALGNAAPQEPYVRAGGWGFFFGDRGSALGIAREAIAWAMQDADRGENSQLGEAALRFFGVGELRQIQHAFAHGELTRAALAAFAPIVLAMAEEAAPNDAAPVAAVTNRARHVRETAAHALAELAVIIDARLPRNESLPRRVSYAGGVFRNEGLRRRFRDPLETSGRSLTFAEPAGGPLDGALLLARRLARDEPIGAAYSNNVRTVPPA